MGDPVVETVEEIAKLALGVKVIFDPNTSFQHVR
jgi:hypothetical protein